MKKLMATIKAFVPQSIKNVYHLGQAIAANVWYGFPSRGMNVIGITGTDGKTTTAQLITRILESSGRNVAMASTINFKIGKREWVNATKFTTLGVFGVQQFLCRAKEAHCDTVVLEVSSQALDQYRAWGIEFEVAVMTNITPEHVEYHGSMERYRAAKRKLFDQGRNAVVNLDMERPEEFLRGNFERALTYSTQNQKADVLAQAIQLGASGSRFEVKGIACTLTLPGLFNIENALAAIAVGKLFGIGLPSAAKALASVQSVPGRMESVDNDRGLTILIDYAVTPHALEKLYALIGETKKPNAKVIAVLGACGGGRDKQKRPVMTGIVSQVADVVILTNEDPYDENPETILDDLEKGLENKTLGKTYFRILDRRKAFAKALELAKQSDNIVITGKGAEETMAVGERRILWNDRRAIVALLTQEKWRRKQP
jgi:UDP-N-acetylmuramoyl-L-alanyl-D-glutamate--2,6-diaminopimelate ligase